MSFLERSLPQPVADQPSCKIVHGGLLAKAGECTNFPSIPPSLYELTKSNCTTMGGAWSEQPCKEKGPSCRYVQLQSFENKVVADLIYLPDRKDMREHCASMRGEFRQP
ncbi:MAG: hypothetical protein AB1344_00430 [Pseudomonadota bacterium]